MISKVALLAILSGFFYGTWPLVMRTSGLSMSWATILVSTGTLIIGLLTFDSAVLPATRSMQPCPYAALASVLLI